jgi:hypothetical protein
MYRSFLALLWICSLTAGQIQAPRIGFLHTSDGLVRSVAGLSASFVLGAPLPIVAVASSFSDTAGVVVRPNEVDVLNQQGAVVAKYPEGTFNGVAGITAGVDTAIVWLPGSRTMLWFDGKVFQVESLTSELPANVISVRRDGVQASMLMLDDSGALSQITVSLKTGNLLTSDVLSDVIAPATYLGTAIISADQLGLPCEATAMNVMATAWLHAACRNETDWAIHFTHGQPKFSQLPRTRAPRLMPIGPHKAASR